MMGRFSKRAKNTKGELPGEEFLRERAPELPFRRVAQILKIPPCFPLEADMDG